MPIRPDPPSCKSVTVTIYEGYRQQHDRHVSAVRERNRKCSEVDQAGNQILHCAALGRQCFISWLMNQSAGPKTGCGPGRLDLLKGRRGCEACWRQGSSAFATPVTTRRQSVLQMAAVTTSSAATRVPPSLIPRLYWDAVQAVESSMLASAPRAVVHTAAGDRRWPVTDELTGPAPPSPSSQFARPCRATRRQRRIGPRSADLPIKASRCRTSNESSSPTAGRPDGRRARHGWTFPYLSRRNPRRRPRLLQCLGTR